MQRVRHVEGFGRHPSDGVDQTQLLLQPDVLRGPGMGDEQIGQQQVDRLTRAVERASSACMS